MIRLQSRFLWIVLPALMLAALAGCPSPSATQHALTVTISGQGDVTPSGGTFDGGAVIALMATPRPGWRFLTWSGDAAGTDNPWPLVMDGDKSVTAIFVEVNTAPAGPVASFTFSPTTGPAPLTVAFADNSDLQSSPLMKRAWNFGDNTGALTVSPASVSDLANPTHVFANPGAYSVTLTVTTGAGSDTASKVVVVTMPSVPKVTVPDLTGKSQPDAQAVLTRVGLALGAVTQEYSETISQGLVSSQDPPYAATVDKGSSVNIALSAGPRPQSSFSVTPSSQSVSAAAGTASFNVVTTGTETLEWMTGVSSGGDWLKIVSNTSGSGNGVINVSFSANTSISPRTGAVSVLVTTPGVPVNIVTASLTQAGAILPVQFPLTLTVTGKGTVAPSPEGAAYDAGTSVTLTATPATNWHFDHWAGGLAGKVNPSAIVMDAAKDITAVFVQDQAQQYSLTTSVSGQGTVDPAGGTYDAGKGVTLTATPAAGWHVDHWFDNVDGLLASGMSSVTITMDKNRAITAFFVQNQHQLTVAASPAQGGSIAPQNAQGTYVEGTTVKLTAIPSAGWRLDHWEITGVTTNPTTAIVSVVLNADVTATAVFVQHFTLTIVKQGNGILNPAQTGVYDSGTEIILTATPDMGWRFDHWEITNVAPNPTTVSTSIYMDGNKTATAIFVQPPAAGFTASPASGAAPLSVQFTDASIPGSAPITAWAWTFGDGSTSAAQNPTHTYSGTGTYDVSLKITTTVGTDTDIQAGYISVSPGVLPTADFTATPVSGTVPLTVKFTDASMPGTSPVTAWLWDFGDGGATSTAQSPTHVYATVGTWDVTLTVTTAVGNSAPKKKTAYITVAKVTVTVPDLSGKTQADAQAAITSAGLVVGTISQQFSATVASGIVINQSPVANTVVDPGSKVNLVVSRGYTLTTSVIGTGGTLAPATGRYDVGKVVTLTATPNAHYRVKAWTDTSNDASTANINTVTMTSDKSVTVAFEPIPQYTLATSVVSGHGTLAPATGTKYDGGTVVTLTATPATGYRVKAWTGTDNNTLKTNANTVTMTADKTVTVEFEALPQFTLTTSVVGGHGTLTPASGTKYNAGTAVPLTAMPATGYRVKAWTGTDNDALKTNANTVTMSADKTVTVQFESTTKYTLTTSVVGGHGTLAPASGTQYDPGASVTLTATPDPSYQVTAWTGTSNDASTANTNTVTMTSNKTVTVAFEGALDAYVKPSPTDPNPAYAHDAKNDVAGTGYTVYVLDLASQLWHPNDIESIGVCPDCQTDKVWHHWLSIIVPTQIKTDTGMLIIDGGGNKLGIPPNWVDPSGIYEQSALRFAVQTGSVIAHLKQIPNEPILFKNDGGFYRSEDDIIAYTFDKYIETGDGTWPLLCPMVKSAVRAMDSVQDFCGKLKTPIAVNHFAVTGGSKRGWTTWLTGAADSTRVSAIAPIVIDILNMDKQMNHHRKAYGYWSDAVYPYERMNVFERLLAVDPNDPTAPENELLQIVDPYQYRARFATMPKLILTSTGDQFFLPDASQFYFSDLPGPKWLNSVPNTEHSMVEAPISASASILAFYTSVLANTVSSIATISWTYSGPHVETDSTSPYFNKQVVSIQATPSIAPVSSIDLENLTIPPTMLPAASLWQAHSPTRSFRLDRVGAIWQGTALTGNSGVYTGTVPVPSTGYTGFFLQFHFPSTATITENGVPIPIPYTFTTAITVVANSSDAANNGGYPVYDGYRTTIGSGTDQYPVVVVYGTPYEMGKKYGALMKTEINSYIPAALTWAQSKDPTDLSTAQLDTAWNTMLPFADKRYTDELQGIADGSGLNFTTLSRANTAFLLMEYQCGTVEAWGAATAGGELFACHDLDWGLDSGAQDYGCLVVYIPDEGTPHVNFGFPGMVGAFAGMNLAGITLAETSSYPDNTPSTKLDAEPFLSRFRDILYDAHRASDVLSIMQAPDSVKKYNFIVGDAIWETRGYKFKARAGLPLAVWTDNDPTDEFYPSVKPGVVYNGQGRGAWSLIKQDYGAIDFDAMTSIGQGMVVPTGNVMDVVLRPTTMDFKVVFGRGTSAAYTRTYAEGNLNRIVQGWHYITGE